MDTLLKDVTAWKMESKEWERGGGGANTFVVFQQQNPHPDQTVLQNICLDCRQVEALWKMKRSNVVFLPAYGTKISFVFRDLFARRDLKAPFGQKNTTVASDHVVS